MEYWMIAVPGEDSAERAYQKLDQAVSRFSSMYRIQIPDLKVGTLDSLVSISDDLAKLDTYTETLVVKLANCLNDLMETTPDKVRDNLLAGNKDLNSFVQHFRWDASKYGPKSTVKALVEQITQGLSEVETNLKTRWQAYVNIRNNLQTLQRKQTGNLLTRALHDIVKKDKFVLGSEYLTTVLVVVQKRDYEDWKNSYEGFCDFVVPRSSELIFEDQDAGLWTVTLMNRKLDMFKQECRKNKFIVRDFTYNEEELEASKNEMTKLLSDKSKSYRPTFLFIKAVFADVFDAWVHVKCLRIFVESVLRYGLPVNFQPVLMLPNKKMQKQLRDTLHKMYQHLDSDSNVPSVSGASDFTPDFAIMGMGEYYPYVYFKLKFDYPGTGPVYGK